MANNTVAWTVENNLCCGCGVCKGICPKDCITWDRANGMYFPQINDEICVSCGLCVSVCPGLGHHYDTEETAAETVTGPVLACYNAWSKESELRHTAASGGVISAMVCELLKKGIYDGVFCLDTYDYREQLKSRLFSEEDLRVNWNNSNTPKSRYLPVSHENAVLYLRKNLDKKLIFIGTSCAIRGLQAVIEKLNLNREKYLLIGLFCDKVFNYNVVSYFSDTYANSIPLEALHFKNKESGGWPGDMKFYPKGKEPLYVPLSERAKAKDYFMPERCLYCVDKLNVCADLSVGDNYTGIDESSLGSNSVMIRSEAGMYAWSTAKNELEIRDVSIKDIQKAQALGWRLNNLYFGDLRSSKIDLNSGVPRENDAKLFLKSWKVSLSKLSAGAVYHVDPKKLKHRVKKDSRKVNPLLRFMRRAVGFIKRRLVR